MKSFLQALKQLLPPTGTALAVGRFPRERNALQETHFELAAASGKPRGLRWLQCDWLPEVTFAADPDSGTVTAFAGVNISFEAVEGGDMEDVEAVSTIRDACAVFHYQNGHWGTGGRTLFNMDPTMALEHLEEPWQAIPGPPGFPILPSGKRSENP